ncbi:MAG TPA: efflux RND transporter periplasmic adaptor subunit [Lysobacter sp.]|nr:efflux RND transporter periplasmic adaptor subunit [Lysobacter sp.]
MQTVLPKRTTVSRPLSVPGSIEPFEQADLYAKVAGYVGDVRADIGDHVRAGQVLAVIDIPEMKAELAEGLARQTAADAALAQAQKKLEVARQQAQGDKSQLRLRELTWQRQQQLFNDKAVTRQQLDEAESQLEVARSQAAMADARIAAAESDIEAAKAACALAAAQVQKIETMMKYAQISAPFAGIVTRRLIDRGAMVQSATSSRTTPLFTVQRIDTLRVFIEVPESALANVKPGLPVKVQPYDPAIAPIEAKVTRVASSLDASTRTMRTEIDLPNPREALLPGMYARVDVSVDLHANALVVPATALVTEGAETFVYIVRDGRAVRMPVKTGLDDGIRVEITEGLADNDAVVTTGKGLIRDGIAVTAARADGTSR